MQKLVTIAVPIYKRLQYLPRVLQAVGAQTYPAVELLISDNGLNGSTVRDQVASLYSRPYTFRQNSESVDITQHFNQMLGAAAGEYFGVLPDDDEISSNFVSELVARLEQYPRAAIAFAGQQIVSESGALLGASRDDLPEMISGPDFIRATWQKYAFGFQSVSMFLGRTRMLRECGGYPNFPRGTHIDDGLVVKMCLRGDVVLSSKCFFRNLVQDSSLGWSVTANQLAAAVRGFMRFLETDDTIRRFAAEHPAEWPDLRKCLFEMSWAMYLGRWQEIYRKRLPFFQWARAAFAMPFIPAYYKRALRTLLKAAGENITARKTEIGSAAG